MGLKPGFNAFGQVIAPGLLTREDRIELLRGMADALAENGALEPSVARFFGRALRDWLNRGGDLQRLLGIKPARGQRSAAAVLRGQKIAQLLVLLNVAVGNQHVAAAVLAGEVTCPDQAEPVLAELRGLHAPRSRSAITRARSAS